MFSPLEGGPATATRSRRRQRPVSSDSLAQQPRAKRQRLPLTEQTFVNPDAAPDKFQTKDKAAAAAVVAAAMSQNGASSKQQQHHQKQHASHQPHQSQQTQKQHQRADHTNQIIAHPLPRKELSVRSKKPKAGERVSKGDGSVVLASNNAYTVNKLPALPDRLRNDPGTRQHGSIYSNTGYALSLSHTHAIVWPYTANTPSPETFTFALPYPSRHVSDPLPLGALVAPSAASEEPGLVVVMPASGKVSYWESISSAATLDFLRQQRTGVEDTIPSMASTERVVDIINAEPAGFVLVLNSGRLAYMGVRDGQGRPAITVQFLRSPSLAAASSGFFGSIRQVLKHSTHHENVVAVRSGPVLKAGERTVVSATSKAVFTAWKIHRGGSHDTLLETDAREAIVSAISDVDNSLSTDETDSLTIVDFAFVPRGVDRKYADLIRLTGACDAPDDTVYPLLVLVSLPLKKQACPYYLVELLLSPESVSPRSARLSPSSPSLSSQVTMVRPIASLRSIVSRQHQTTDQPPRLYLPKPAVVAYLVFDQAVVLASLAQPPESPDSQLQEESSGSDLLLPATFEDVIDLRNDGTLEIVGSGAEDPQHILLPEAEGPRIHRHKSKNPAAVLLVRGVGVVRLATVDVDRFVGEQPPEVTAKSKLEQAVFFGIKGDNPLAFEGRRPPSFSDEEMGSAAMQLSRDILGSKTAFTPSVPASLESNLRLRSSYLDRLIRHLTALRVHLSREVRWRLLADAEKMATATSLWVLHEQFLGERASESSSTTTTTNNSSARKTIISEIVEYIHEDEKKNPNRDSGEVDRVRYFFVNDVWRMDLFIAWAYEVIKYVYKDHLLDDRGVTRLLYEGLEVNFRALNGATTYRVDHLDRYGLQDEDLASGILVSGYEGLPEPWTSTYFITNNAKRLVDLCCNWLDQFYPPKVGESSPVDPGLIEAIREALPNLTDRYLLALLEHYRWSQTRDDDAQRTYGERCLKAYYDDRYAKVYRLKNYGLWDDAIDVAKRHHSLHAMAEIMVEEVRKLRSDVVDLHATDPHSKEKRALAVAKEQRIAQSFDVYGEEFAFAVYEILLRDDGIKTVLDFPGDTSGHATRFLRSKPELARIAWINDVEREKDMASAAQTLLRLGVDHEQRLWNKKIELSLGKLCLLAAEETETTQVSQVTQVTQVNRHLDVIRIQDLLYAWIAPSVAAAVDDAAALQLAVEAHGMRIPRRQKAVLQLFEDAMRRLLRHEALDAFGLIDLLTLVTLRPDDEDGLPADEDVFSLALLVAFVSLPEGASRRAAQRLVWRRCFLRDDWAQINNTQLQDDAATASVLRLTAVYNTAYALAIQHNVDDSFPFSTIKPSDALGVFSDPADPATAARFHDLDAPVRDKLLEAMRHEDVLLRRAIDKSRLDDWARTAVDAAQTACHLEMQRLSNGNTGEVDGVDGVEVDGPVSSWK